MSDRVAEANSLEAQARAARDLREAAALLRRAIALLPERHPRRLELQIGLGDTLGSGGDFEATRALYAEVLEAAQAIGDRRIEARVRLERAYLGQITEPDGLARFHEVAREAIPVLEEHGDDEGLWRAWQAVGRAHGAVGRSDLALDAADRAIRHAGRAGRDPAYAVYTRAILELLGATPVADVVRRAEELVEHERLRGFALQALAHTHAMLGDFDAARGFVERHEEASRGFGKEAPTEVGGDVELLAGDHASAERKLRPIVETYRRSGDRGHGGTVLALLARAVLEQGRSGEAAELLAELDDWTSPEDIGERAELDALRARLIGDEALARAAVDRLAETDWLNLRARLLHDLALVARDPEPAEQAAELYTRKGNVVARRAALRTAQDLRTGRSAPG